MNRREVIATFLFIIGIAWSYHALAVFLMKPCGALNQCLTTAAAMFAIPLIMMTAAFALFSLLIFLMKYNTELIKLKNKGLDRL